MAGKVRVSGLRVEDIRTTRVGKQLWVLVEPYHDTGVIYEFTSKGSCALKIRGGYVCDLEAAMNQEGILSTL
jgi:hypothetical protein